VFRLVAEECPKRLEGHKITSQAATETYNTRFLQVNGSGQGSQQDSIERRGKGKLAGIERLGAEE
jgi:hypothetical protein